MKLFKILVFIIVNFILVCFDQYSKKLATVMLKRADSFPIIRGVLEFTYVENRGAAFGILQGKQTFFYILTVVVFAVIFYLYYKTSFDKHFALFHISLILISSGAIGNFIDRYKNKFVVDFIYFKPINFPVFNVADMMITIGTVILFLSIFTIYKNDNII